jgi:hypothetical protein
VGVGTPPLRCDCASETCGHAYRQCARGFDVLSPKPWLWQLCYACAEVYWERLSAAEKAGH